MDVGQLLMHVDALAPFALAEEWDNVGLMVGRRDRPVTRVLTALDLRQTVLDDAMAQGAQAIVVHHPPIFPALSAVSDAREAGRLVLRAAEDHIAVIAAHTNLDSARDGLNDLMASALGISNTTVLMPNTDDPSVGLGRVGDVPSTTLATFAAIAVQACDPGGVNLGMAGDPRMTVCRVAVCTGSGGSLVAAARDAGAHAYVTGDLKYHDFDTAEGMGLVNLSHGVVEAHMMRRWTPALAERLTPHGVAVSPSVANTDPWCPAC